MKVFRDILKVLQIETVYVIKNFDIFMCMPLEINENQWLISCDSDELSGPVILKIKFNGSFIYLNSVIKKIQQDSIHSFIYSVSLSTEEFRKDSMCYLFYMMVNELLEENSEWNKRSEERYDIGLDENKIKAMGFKNIEQKIIFEKKQLPCMINNVSYSGAKITTTEDLFQNEKKLCICYSFVNPIEQVPILGTIRNCFIKTLNNNQNVSILSLQYDEIPYAYRKRIENFIKNTGEIK